MPSRSLLDFGYIPHFVVTHLAISEEPTSGLYAHAIAFFETGHYFKNLGYNIWLRPIFATPILARRLRGYKTSRRFPPAKYERLIAAATAEEAGDVAIYDARMAELGGDRTGVLPAEVRLAMLKGAIRFRALRRWRKLSQAVLAAKAGIGQGYLSDIENPRRIGAPDALEKLAAALDASVKWLE